MKWIYKTTTRHPVEWELASMTEEEMLSIESAEGWELLGPPVNSKRNSWVYYWRKQVDPTPTATKMWEEIHADREREEEKAREAIEFGKYLRQELNDPSITATKEVYTEWKKQQ